VTTAAAVAASIALGWVVAPDERAPLLISVLAVALAGRALSAWAQHLFAAVEASHHTLRQELVFRLLDLAVAVAVLLTGGGPLRLVVAQAVVWWAQAARALWIVRSEIVPVRVDWHARRWRRLLTLAVPLFVTALAVDWRLNGALVLFRNLTPDGNLFGQFALAMQPFFFLAALPVALVTAVQPALTRAVQRGDGKDLVYARTVLRAALLLGTAAALGGMALGPPLFGLLFGPAYEVAGQLVGFSLWCLVPLGAGMAFPPVILARGHFRLTMLGSVCGALAMTILMPLLAPAFGARGAIAAVFAGFALPPLLLHAYAVSEGWADPWPRLLRPLAAVALAVGAYLALASWSAALALAVALLILGTASAALGVVTPAERAVLSSLRTEWRARRRAEP
jgi:O-antigen/teichoic acid export membrane protein